MPSAAIVLDGTHASEPPDLATQIAPWTALAESAARAERIAEFTHTAIATSGYQSTTQTLALVLALGRLTPQLSPSVPTGDGGEGQGIGLLHVYAYPGKDTAAHDAQAQVILPKLAAQVAEALLSGSYPWTRGGGAAPPPPTQSPPSPPTPPTPAPPTSGRDKWAREILARQYPIVTGEAAAPAPLLQGIQTVGLHEGSYSLATKPAGWATSNNWGAVQCCKPSADGTCPSGSFLAVDYDAKSDRKYQVCFKSYATPDDGAADLIAS